MSLSEAQVSGGSGDVAEALIKAAPALKKVGMDGAKMAAEILADRKHAEELDAEQEEAKRILRAKTGAKDDAYHRLWVKASGYLDMVIAAVQKDSDEAANFRRIRSRIARPPPEETPVPQPVPGPAQ